MKNERFMTMVDELLKEVVDTLDRKSMEYSTPDERFMTMVDELLKEVVDTLDRKSMEYSTPDERFHNFDLVAGLLGCNREQAIYMLSTKHIVSIRDAVMQCVPLTMDEVREKVTDTIAYMLLLYAAMYEARKG